MLLGKLFSLPHELPSRRIRPAVVQNTKSAGRILVALGGPRRNCLESWFRWEKGEGREKAVLKPNERPSKVNNKLEKVWSLFLALTHLQATLGTYTTQPNRLGLAGSGPKKSQVWKPLRAGSQTLSVGAGAEEPFLPPALREGSRVQWGWAIECVGKQGKIWQCLKKRQRIREIINWQNYIEYKVKYEKWKKMPSFVVGACYLLEIEIFKLFFWPFPLCHVEEASQLEEAKWSFHSRERKQVPSRDSQKHWG